MGQTLSSKLLIVGLDGAGKTNLLQYLEEGPNTTAPPKTTSFDTREIKYKGVKFAVFDVAGSVKDLWKHYYSGTDAVVWVIDSADEARFGEAAEALQIAIKDPEMKKDLPVLIACNKSDLSGAKSVEDIKAALHLDSVLKGREWTAIKTDSKKGDGVHEGFLWLTEQIKTLHKKHKGKS